MKNYKLKRKKKLKNKDNKKKVLNIKKWKIIMIINMVIDYLIKKLHNNMIYNYKKIQILMKIIIQWLKLIYAIFKREILKLIWI